MSPSESIISPLMAPGRSLAALAGQAKFPRQGINAHSHRYHDNTRPPYDNSPDRRRLASCGATEPASRSLTDGTVTVLEARRVNDSEACPSLTLKGTKFVY